MILEDFTEDPQKWQDTAGWQAQQLAESSGPLETPEGWAAAFKAERSGLLPRWQTAQTRFGRTTVGSFQAPSAWPMFATRFLAGALPTVPDLDTPAIALRMLFRRHEPALYGVAAQALKDQHRQRTRSTHGSGDKPLPDGCLRPCAPFRCRRGNNAAETVAAVKVFAPAYRLP